MDYCLDSSALINPWNMYYPPKLVPELWDVRLDAMISSGQICSSVEVLRELEQKDDALFAWAKQRQHTLFLASEAPVQLELRDVLQQFPRMAGKGGRKPADPWVVALARVRQTAVVSEELGGNVANPKIPFVCQQLGVRCIRFTEFMIECRWVLRF